MEGIKNLRGLRTWIRSMFALAIFCFLAAFLELKEAGALTGLGIAIGFVLAPSEVSAGYKSGQYQKYNGGKNESK